MNTTGIVSRNDWLKARIELLEKEKELTRLRDQISAERRKLPWVKITSDYRFDGENGEMTLAELFEDKSQLIVYHFMMGPDWQDACPSCSFWADNFNGIDIHLAHRDISFLAVSRTDYDSIRSYKKKMGWSFRWLSSLNSDFNYDFGVSFSEQDRDNNKIEYNYREQEYFIDELPGVSVFIKNAEGEVFHTYSTYARGLDILNGAYHYIDLTAKGRDESDGMSWVRRHDEY